MTPAELEALYLDTSASDEAQGLSAKDRAHAAAQGAFVAIFTNGEAMVGAGVYVSKAGGFRVIVKALDAGLVAGIKVFTDLAAAEAYAKKC